MPSPGAIVSAGFGFGASILSYQAQVNAAKSNARLLDLKAAHLELMATDALFRGDVGQADIRFQEEQIKSQQKTAIANTSADLNSGSAVAAEASQATMSAIERSRIARNARMEAFGHKAQAISTRLEGQIGVNNARANVGGVVASGGNFIGSLLG